MSRAGNTYKFERQFKSNSNLAHALIKFSPAYPQIIFFSYYLMFGYALLLLTALNFPQYIFVMIVIVLAVQV